MSMQLSHLVVNRTTIQSDHPQLSTSVDPATTILEKFIIIILFIIANFWIIYYKNRRNRRLNK
jgi:hypothetical protein